LSAAAPVHAAALLAPASLHAAAKALHAAEALPLLAAHAGHHHHLLDRGGQLNQFLAFQRLVLIGIKPLQQHLSPLPRHLRIAHAYSGTETHAAAHLAPLTAALTMTGLIGVSISVAVTKLAVGGNRRSQDDEQTCRPDFLHLHCSVLEKLMGALVPSASRKASSKVSIGSHPAFLQVIRETTRDAIASQRALWGCSGQSVSPWSKA
jgi:hypothetical protein